MTVVVQKRKKSVMTPLEFWRLKQFRVLHGIDSQEIDPTLTYYENMKHLSQFVPKTVADTVENCALDMVDPRVEEITSEAVEYCQTIADREIGRRKWAKYKVGKRLLKDRECLKIRYGDNYYGKMAKEINRPGYGEEQLRKCVRFAKHPLAWKWLNDPKISWERIRTKLLRKKLDQLIRSLRNALLNIMQF